MAENLGIGGVKPISDRPPGNGNQSKSQKGTKFSLDGGSEESGREENRKPKTVEKKRRKRPSDPKESTSKIDILV